MPKQSFSLWMSILFFAANLPLFAGVNPDGSYSETISIALPPARNNVAPQLALSYNSNSGSSVAGWGWNITGIGVITRINDGNGIRFAGQDTFAGPQGKLYNMGNGTFHAQNETFASYVPQGTCGDGPCYWVVTDAQGNKSFFGLTGDAQAWGNGGIRTWALNRVEDIFSNYYAIQYAQNGGQQYVSTIEFNRYGFNYHRVDFSYEGRPDAITQPHANQPITSAWRLRSVQVYANCGMLACLFGEERNRYDLQYSEAGGISRLINVEVHFGNILLNRISLNYSPLVPPPPGSLYADGRGDFSPSDLAQTTLQGDFDADGKLDVIWRRAAWPGWLVDYGNGTFTYLTDNHPDFVPQDRQISHAGDFDGDGKTDVAWRRSAWPGWQINYGTGEVGWLGDGHSDFAPQDRQISYVGDFDGDGRMDIAWRRSAWPGWQINYGHGGVGWLGDSHSDFASEDRQVSHLGDFDGDGRTDIAWRRSAWPGWRINYGNGTPGWLGDGHVDFALDNRQASGVGDFDADGKTDIAWRRDAWGVWLVNTGTGGVYALSDGRSDFTITDFYNNASQVGAVWLVGDFDGDGRSDIAWRRLGFAAWMVNYGTGASNFLPSDGQTGFFAVRASGSISADMKFFQVGDFDGDGKSDIAWRYPSEGIIFVDPLQGNNCGGGLIPMECVTHPSPEPFWRINYGSGQAPGTMVDNVIPFLTNDAEAFAGDFNADGVTDLGWRNAASPGYGMVMGQITAPGRLLSSVTDIAGKQLLISYEAAARMSGAVQAAQPNCDAGSGGSYNSICGIADVRQRALVTEVKQIDGPTGTLISDTGYMYYNSRLFMGLPKDRKSLGFGFMRVANLMTGAFDITYYYQAPLIAGIFKSSYSQIKKSNGAVETVLSKYQPPPSVFTCDLNGCLNGVDVTSNFSVNSPMQVRMQNSFSNGMENSVSIMATQESVLQYNAFGQPLVMQTSRSASGLSRMTTKIISYTSPSSAFPAGLPYGERVCLGAAQCLTGDANFISETRSYYNNEPLGTATTLARVSKKESYALTGASSGVWLAETYQYDSYGNVIDTTDATGVRTEISYDSTFNQYPQMVVKTHSNRQMTTVNTYDARFGKAWHTRDLETNNENILSFDDTGFVYAKETRNGSTVLARSTYAHSPFGSSPAWSQECKAYGATFAQSSCTKKISDAFGRVYREEFPELVAGVETQMAIERRFDAEGRETQVSQPFPSIHSGCAETLGAGANPFDCKWNTKNYDPYGRQTGATTFDNKSSTVAYESAATGLDMAPAVSCVTTTALGKTSKSCSNIDGKPVMSHDGYQGGTYTSVYYTYDERARLTQVDAPQGQTRTGYVGNSSLQSYIDDPVSGRTDYDYYFTPGSPSFGKLKTETRGGFITTFEYNATFGRVSKTTKAAASAPGTILETTTYIYDQGDVSFGKGKLTTLTHVKDGFTIQERYSYNAKGETVQTTRRISHATETLCADTNAMPCLQVFGKTTDELGRVKSMLYPDGKVSQVEYVSPLGSHVAKIKHDGTTYATYSDYSYDVGVHVGKVTYGNGLEQQYTYQPTTGLLETTKIGLANQNPYIDLKYEYFSDNNIYKINDRVIPDLTTTFEYDGHSRLKSATMGSGAVRTYKFDRDGQQQSKGNLELKDKRRMAYAANKTYPASDEVYNSDTNDWQANQAFSWSATGALLTKGPFTFTYDSNNMMTKAVETVPFDSAQGTETQGGSQAAAGSIAAESKFYYDHTGQRFLKTHLRGGVMIKTWYLGDGIEIREKFMGATSTGTGSFEAMQATKYIYGIDDKKLASITGSVKTSQLGATASTLFALAEGFSSTTVTGLGFKTFYTFYGIYGCAAEHYRELTPAQARILLLAMLALLLALYLFLSHPSTSLRGREAGERSRTADLGRRATALVMLFAFISVHCGTGNVPGSTPVDLGGSGPTALGTGGDATTAAQPSSTFISALYTGLPTGTVYYSHNHLGSGALVTDASGNEIFRITYTEYGEIDFENSGKWNSTTEEFERTVTDAEIAITAVKYTGQEYDPETGFYYYNARYYDPQVGVFTTADTEFDGDQGSFAFNRHMYVRGNPVMYTDPSGHFFFAALIQLAGLIAGAGAATRGAVTNDWSARNLAVGAGQGLAIGGGIVAGIATGGAAFGVYGATASIGATVGGVMAGTHGNIAGWINGSQAFDWNSAWKGALAGGIGAVAGVGGGALGSAMFGTSTLAGSIAAGATAGLASGFAGGSTSAWLNGASFEQGLLAGAIGGGIGLLAGGVAGAGSYGYDRFISNQVDELIPPGNLPAEKRAAIEAFEREKYGSVVRAGASGYGRLIEANATNMSWVFAKEAMKWTGLAGFVKGFGQGLINRKNFGESFVEGLSQGAQWGLAGGIGTYALTTTLTLTVGGAGSGVVTGLMKFSFKLSNPRIWLGAGAGLAASGTNLSYYGLPFFYQPYTRRAYEK